MTLPAEFQACAKPFEAAAYKDVNVGRGFTTIDAYHIVERLTEVFGLCGQGWGTQNVTYELHDKNVAAIGELWYRLEEGGAVPERCVIPAVGDAVVFKGNIAEAYKKAQTNLISKASSYLGIGLSVYQGKGIDDPYLDRENTAGRALSDSETSEPVSAPKVGPGAGVASVPQWDGLRALCAEHSVPEEELMVRLSEAPFCIKQRRDLLAAHVPKLTEWITGESR